MHSCYIVYPLQQTAIGEGDQGLSNIAIEEGNIFNGLNIKNYSPPGMINCLDTTAVVGEGFTAAIIVLALENNIPHIVMDTRSNQTNFENCLTAILMNLYDMKMVDCTERTFTGHFMGR